MHHFNTDSEHQKWDLNFCFITTLLVFFFLSFRFIKVFNKMKYGQRLIRNYASLTISFLIIFFFFHEKGQKPLKLCKRNSIVCSCCDLQLILSKITQWCISLNEYVRLKKKTIFKSMSSVQMITVRRVHHKSVNFFRNFIKKIYQCTSHRILFFLKIVFSFNRSHVKYFYLFLVVCSRCSVDSFLHDGLTD